MGRSCRPFLFALPSKSGTEIVVPPKHDARILANFIGFVKLTAMTALSKPSLGLDFIYFLRSEGREWM